MQTVRSGELTRPGAQLEPDTYHWIQDQGAAEQDGGLHRCKAVGEAIPDLDYVCREVEEWCPDSAGKHVPAFVS